MALVVGVLVPSLLAGLAVAAAGTAPPPTPVPPHGSLSPLRGIGPEALKIKAGQLGQIKEMTEDAQAGSLTIVLEV